MCGIYGFAAAAESDLGAAFRVSEILDAMDASLVHRGPDDSGQYRDDDCAFGMRRLSIIDLPGGRQPIANEDGQIRVVFNGEIYNYRDLRADLERRGHRFATQSDTEVIVHLYEERGDSLVEQIDGMFAFALWDRNRRCLLLARDRLGIKPLYWAATPKALVFGSELKALLPHPEIAREISPAALSHYLSFGVTPQEQSILRQVRKLLPGHLLRYRRGCVEVRRYWDLRPHFEGASFSAQPRSSISEKDAPAEVRRLLERAVRSHLVSDVPVGAFLSGGIDSATVVGLMSQLGARPKTFSIGFDSQDFDELKWARLVARHYATDHHELVVRPDAWELLEPLVWHLDEPFADVSAIPTYLVSQMAARQVKVVLSGDGGDELFAGYDRYPAALEQTRLADAIPQRGKRLLGKIAAALPDIAPYKNRLRQLSLGTSLRYIEEQSLFPTPIKARLRGPLFDDPRLDEQVICDQERLLDEAPGDLLGRLQYFETMTYLPLDILTKVDRMTMAHSLEARPPLIDHRLVEAVAALPSRLKLAGRLQKAILKKAVVDLVPAPILLREKKGFGVPIRHWFRGPLRDTVRALLEEPRTRQRGHFDQAFVRTLFAEHTSGRRDQSLQLWALCVLEQWCRQFLDRPSELRDVVPRRSYG